MAQLTCKNLTLGYDNRAIQEDLNFSIDAGDYLCIVGENGSGKSTLMKTLLHLQAPISGSIELGDGLKKNEIGYLPQQTLVQRDFPASVREIVLSGCQSRCGWRPFYNKEEKMVAQRAMEKMMIQDLADQCYRELSGGQQQRVLLARALCAAQKILLLDEPLAALDLKMRKDMQMELKEMHKTLGITFVYVTHDQEEALTLSDTIVVMSEGRIQQIGTPTDIYNEPINSFVADFIGESNILNGVMVKDKLVHFCDRDFECVDEGFGENTPVDVVIRPEDLYIFPVSDMAQLRGTVQSCIFKGVHYEMVVLCHGYEFVVQDYHAFEAGTEVGMLVKPFDIHIMKKERICNTFEGKLIDETHVEFLGCEFECAPVDLQKVPLGDVLVDVDFGKINLLDNAEDGMLTGEVKFILYKGNHYHLTVWSDWDENVFVDTNDVWDDGDRVGISIAPEDIRVRVKQEER